MTLQSTIRHPRSQVCVVVVLLLAAVTLPPCLGAGLMRARPEEVGANPAALSQVPSRMNDLIAKKRIVGAVTLVACKGKVVQFSANGLADIVTR